MTTGTPTLRGRLRHSLGRLSLTLERISAPLGVQLALLNTKLVQLGTKMPGLPPVTAYCVWRPSNVDTVRVFINYLPPGTQVHLHCLDGDGEGVLSRYTRSVGAGPRMHLLQGLITSNPPGPGRWVMLFDDDVRFASHNPGDFFRIAQHARFDISQPAHTASSYATYPMTRARFLSVARETEFVEVGPVVLVSPTGAKHVLPFPPHIQMGWGLDVEWLRLARDGLVRLGIVDAAPIVHEGVVGRDYVQSGESELLGTYLRDEGVSSVKQLARDKGPVWRPWRPRPPW